MVKKNSEGLDNDFYNSLVNYTLVQALELSDKSFTKTLLAEGWDKRHFTSPRESSGLTVLWPDEKLSLNISNLRKNESTRKQAEELVKSLIFETLILKPEDFEGASTKSGDKVSGSKGSSDTIKFKNGATAVLDKRIKAPPMFSMDGKDMENKRLFAVWHLSKDFPFDLKIGGAISGSKSSVSFDEKIGKTLQEVFLNDTKNIKVSCSKLVATMYEQCIKGTNEEECFNCLIQGVPLAEFFVIANSDIFNINFEKVLENWKDTMEDSYVEIFNKTKDNKYACTGKDFNIPSSSSELYNLYEEISKNGAGVICPHLSKHFFALRDFYSKMKNISMWAFKRPEDSTMICQAILRENALSNARVGLNNGLPEGIFSSDEDSSAGRQHVLSKLHESFGSFFFKKEKYEITGGAEGKDKHYDRLIKSLSALTPEKVKKLLQDKRLESSFSMLKQEL